MVFRVENGAAPTRTRTKALLSVAVLARNIMGFMGGNINFDCCNLNQNELLLTHSLDKCNGNQNASN